MLLPKNLHPNIIPKNIHSFIYFSFCQSIQGHRQPTGYRTCWQVFFASVCKEIRLYNDKCWTRQ